MPEQLIKKLESLKVDITPGIDRINSELRKICQKRQRNDQQIHLTPGQNMNWTQERLVITTIQKNTNPRLHSHVRLLKHYYFRKQYHQEFVQLQEKLLAQLTKGISSLKMPSALLKEELQVTDHSGIYGHRFHTLQKSFCYINTQKTHLQGQEVWELSVR